MRTVYVYCVAYCYDVSGLWPFAFYIKPLNQTTNFGKISAVIAPLLFFFQGDGVKERQRP